MKRRTVIAGLSASCAGLAIGCFGDRKGDGKNRDKSAASADKTAEKSATEESCGTTTLKDGKPILPLAYSVTLRAMCDRLVPAETGVALAAGALSVGAFEYILREIGRPEMKSTRRTLMRGAAVLNRQAKARLGVIFHSADGEKQDMVIQSLLDGDGASAKFAPAEFVRTMVGLTLEGMFSDPIWGGNKGGEGWKAIGYNMHSPRPDSCH